jgi:hypothetical protein
MLPRRYLSCLCAKQDYQAGYIFRRLLLHTNRTDTKQTTQHENVLAHEIPQFLQLIHRLFDKKKTYCLRVRRVKRELYPLNAKACVAFFVSWYTRTFHDLLFFELFL